MTSRTVTTQLELDAALADEAVESIVIDSPRGVWLRMSAYGSASVRASGSASVEASGSASVRASGSASVEASGSASVEAYGSASVRASGSASVRASGSASVRAYGSASVRASGSASVEAYGSASVEAYGSASVRAYGSASVRAYDSASVRASGSASVEAYGSASVRASGSASVRAYDSAKATCTPHVAVHLHSAHATITGGVIIDLTQLDLNDPRTWCEHHGVDITDTGTAMLFKATDPDLQAGHDYQRTTTYTPGARVACTDWRDDHFCGGGLHLSPRPRQAKEYRRHDEKSRFLRVEVDLANLRPIDPDKCKVRACTVVEEVDIMGRPVTPTEVTVDA